MNILYFDTTQDWIHVLVAEANDNFELNIKSKIIESSPKEASYRLVELIQTTLMQANVIKPDRIFVPHGPGSFTGIRITVTTARDLAQLWDIPVIGFDSALLYLVGMEGNNHYFQNTKLNQKFNPKTLICLDGKQGKFYTKYYNGNTFSETEDQKPDQIKQLIEKGEITPNKWYYTGNLPEFYPEGVIKIEATNLNLSSIMKYSLEQTKQIELKDYNYLSLLPNYIRGTYVDLK
ncbi:tRNA (adenosine(37)-N6)-threonylcarbamoyltransferase complex dimerization subunit type 1 TsaB [Leptospira sp. WS39.C2]